MPASLAFFTPLAMACESTASNRITSTRSSIICCSWLACLSALASALAYSTRPWSFVRDSTFCLMMG